MPPSSAFDRNSDHNLQTVLTPLGDLLVFGESKGKRPYLSAGLPQDINILIFTYYQR